MTYAIIHLSLCGLVVILVLMGDTPTPEVAERIRSMTDEELAGLLSSAWHAADYEDDDYDPAILNWLRQSAN